MDFKNVPLVTIYIILCKIVLTFQVVNSKKEDLPWDMCAPLVKVLIDKPSTSGQNYRTHVAIDFHNETENFNYAMSHKNMAANDLFFTSCQCSFAPNNNMEADIQVKLLQDSIEPSSACRHMDHNWCKDIFSVETFKKGSTGSYKEHDFTDIMHEHFSRLHEHFSRRNSKEVLTYKRDINFTPSVTSLKIEIISTEKLEMNCTSQRKRLQDFVVGSDLDHSDQDHNNRGDGPLMKNEPILSPFHTIIIVIAITVLVVIAAIIVVRLVQYKSRTPRTQRRFHYQAPPENRNSQGENGDRYVELEQMRNINAAPNTPEIDNQTGTISFEPHHRNGIQSGRNPNGSLQRSQPYPTEYQDINPEDIATQHAGGNLVETGPEYHNLPTTGENQPTDGLTVRENDYVNTGAENVLPGDQTDDKTEKSTKVEIGGEPYYQIWGNKKHEADVI